MSTDRLSEAETFGPALAQIVDRHHAPWPNIANEIESWFGTKTRSALVRELEECGALTDPHVFGWVHQHLGTRARQEAFELHTRHEAKHTDSVVATQVYTPRWVAELLVREALAACPVDSRARATITDPACGGGQFLLVGFHELVRAGAPPAAALEQLTGTDLDPTAVDAARRGLKWAAIRAGLDQEAAAELARRAVGVGDGLTLTPKSADIIATNPPYLGRRSMPDLLKQRLVDDFRPFHVDLAAAFIDRCVDGARVAAAILSQQNIWYLSRFEAARRDLLGRGSMRLYAHFGAHLFSVLKGEKASVVGFVMQTRDTSQPPELTRFYDLRDETHAAAMRRVVSRQPGRMRSISDVTSLPGVPIAHWVPDRLLKAFGDEVPRLGDLFAVPGSQNKTGRNREFVRPASEVADIASLDAASSDGEQWRFYSKGGRYAPWWGNWDWAVDWSDRAREFYADNRTSNLLSDEWVDRVGLVYTDFGGRTFNARWKPPTALFDMAGPAIFHGDDDERALYALLVYLNSEPARTLLNAMNPSLHYQVRDVRRLPLPGWGTAPPAEAAELGQTLVSTARDALKRGEEASLRELEISANAWACRQFGVDPAGPLPRHHRFA